jgi:hypothetical protein
MYKKELNGHKVGQVSDSTRLRILLKQFIGAYPNGVQSKAFNIVDNNGVKVEEVK